MYRVTPTGFAEFTKGSAAVKMLQAALQAAGFSLGTADGTFGPKTKAAMQAFQKARGMEVHNWPTVPVLEALGISPASWQAIAADAGAPGMVVKSVAARAASAGDVVEDMEEPLVLPLPGAGPEVVVTEQMLPAAAAGGAGPWLKKNWKYVAIGTGAGVVLLLGAVLISRRQAAAAEA